MKISLMRWAILILTCVFCFNTGYGQGGRVIPGECKLPEFKYAWFIDTSDVVLKHENLEVRYKMDSTHSMNNAIITLIGVDSSRFIYMNGFVNFRSDGVDYAIFANSTDIRVLSVNNKNCMVKDVAFHNGTIYSDFHCDYSKSDTCVFVTYEKGKPSKFSEGKPFAYREPADSSRYHNTDYDLIMLRRGWYDDDGKKHYYPPVR